MKKHTIVTLALLLTSVVAFAQEEVGNPKVYTVPAVFYPTDEVTFYFDMADAGLTEGTDLYWWVWQPLEPDAGNWDNSSDFAKLEYMGDNMYKKTFVPVDYFFQNQDRFATKDELLAFMESDWGEAGYWSRLKTKDGSLQSGVFCVEHNRTEIADFAASGAAVQLFAGQKGEYTEKWVMNKPLSILFNGDVQTVGGKTLNEWAAQGGFKYFGTHAGLHGFYTTPDDEVIEYDFNDNPPNLNQQFNVWRPGCIEKTSLKNIGNGVWRWNLMLPQEYFCYNPVNLDEDPRGYVLTDMGMDQNGTWAVNPDFTGSFVAESIKFGIVVNDWENAQFDFEFKAGTAEPYPDPSFSFFPSKVCSKDIITFIRQYNGRTDGELTWTVTCGDSEFGGVMDGNRDKRQGSANLLEGLGSTAEKSMHLVVKNVKGATVVETDIPLTSVDE